MNSKRLFEILISIKYCQIYFYIFSVQEVLKKESNYIISDPHVYSIQDLLHVKCGSLPLRLQELVEACNMHIIGCEVIF